MLNLKIIINILGFMLILEGIFMFAGIPFSLYYGDNDIIVLLSCGAGVSLFGLILKYLTRDYVRDISKRDGYIIVSLSWIVISLFGALPFIIYGAIPNYTDAFFETVSGFTTTGASILNNIESLPHGLLMWRSMTHWIGGMGIILLSLAILPMLGFGGMQLFVAEVPGPTKDKIHPRISETAKRLWLIYVMFTAAETVLLYFGGMTFFDAVNHSFATMATGGFSTKQASIGYYDSPFIHYIIIIFMFIAGTNFTLHYHMLHAKFGVYRKDDEFKSYLWIIISLTLIITISLLLLHTYTDVEQAFRDALFQVVSVITCTGYITKDYDVWGHFFQFLFLIMMFIGGSVGSTSGSIKIMRHLLIFRNINLELRRLIHPKAVIPVRLNGNAVPQDIMFNILTFFIIYIVVFIAGTIGLSLAGMDTLSSMGAVATCMGNIGPGIGTVGPAYSYAGVPEAAKWILALIMLLGRLEFFTIMIIFSKSFWKP